MFIIFGWGKQTQKQTGHLDQVACPRCSQSTKFEFWELKTWFTLFFIPVFPYETRRLLVCANCEKSVTIPKEVAQQMNASNYVDLSMDLIQKKPLEIKIKTRRNHATQKINQGPENRRFMRRTGRIIGHVIINHTLDCRNPDFGWGLEPLGVLDRLGICS